MSRDQCRPYDTRPGTRPRFAALVLRTDAGKPPTDPPKPPPTGPKDTRPPRGPVQPPYPHPQDPDKLPDPRPGRVLATIVGLLLLARHRAPADEPLGSRRHDPRHAAGDWHPGRDEPAAPAWPGGKRPPLRTNLEDQK